VVRGAILGASVVECGWLAAHCQAVIPPRFDGTGARSDRYRRVFGEFHVPVGVIVAADPHPLITPDSTIAPRLRKRRKD
jgi:hypothetical protein